MPEARASSATRVSPDVGKQSLSQGHDGKVKLNVAICLISDRWHGYGESREA